MSLLIIPSVLFLSLCLLIDFFILIIGAIFMHIYLSGVFYWISYIVVFTLLIELLYSFK